jgi:phage shock protein PspC (stress-responsive transcriptional regulator)
MPSLLRFLTVLGIIFGLGYVAIYALATYVNPKPREISVTIPPDRLVKQPH